MLFPSQMGQARLGVEGEAIFFQFWWLLFRNDQAVCSQTLLQAAGFICLPRPAEAKWQPSVCEQLVAAAAEHAARACSAGVGRARGSRCPCGTHVSLFPRRQELGLAKLCLALWLL